MQELAQQIKLYQARINEISEKSHMLAERSADLGPLCARKLYHTGDGETRVLDLMNTLNAPLEPYVSPLSSPKSPKQSVKYQYENPLKLFKNTEIGPIVTRDTGGAYNSDSYVADARKRREPGFGSMPSISPVETSPVLTERIDPTINLQNFASRPGEKSVSRSSPNVSRHSPSWKYQELGSKKDSMDATVTYPDSLEVQPKRAHSTERSVTEQPKQKVPRSTDLNASFDIGSVKSGSTEDPNSSITRSADADREDSISLSSHPFSASGDAASLANQIYTPERSHDRSQRSYGQPISEDLITQAAESRVESQMLPQEMLTLRQRKEAALSPYQPKSKYLAPKLGEEDEGEDAESEYYDTIANEFNDAPGRDGKDSSLQPRRGFNRASRGPLRGDHKVNLPESQIAREPGYRSVSPMNESRRSYKPRSPSPLTLPPTSRSQHDISSGKRSTFSDGPPRRSSSIERMKGHRSVSPRTVAMTMIGTRSNTPTENQDPMSKSLTAGQMRSMGSPANKDKLSKEAWDPVGVCAFAVSQGHSEYMMVKVK
mgnify:FL=1